MSAALIPLPANTPQWCDLLFHLSKPVIMTESEFDEYWPLISTVYTKIGGLLLQQNGEVQVQKYECRLRKSKKGGKPPARGVKKCYSKTVRVPGLCDVRIKTTRTVSAPITITIQRLDEHEHRHTLERSREIAPSTIALHLAATEAAKGYAPAQVLNALRGIGTPEGSKRLIEVGGAHLTRYV